VAQLLKKLWRKEAGEALQEYALLLLLISMVVIAGLKGLASNLDHAYLKASTRVIAAGSMESINTDPISTTDPNQSTPQAKPEGVASATTGERIHAQSPPSTKP
jgi:Flp pilus assembly pilin Flp